MVFALGPSLLTNEVFLITEEVHLHVVRRSQPKGDSRRQMIFNVPPSVHQLARAAITNYSKLGGSKQEKFILSQFWRPEV